jgi:murein DD-endopeptidase MepM/ murein hydrolase activator NlpD
MRTKLALILVFASFLVAAAVGAGGAGADPLGSGKAVEEAGGAVEGVLPSEQPSSITTTPAKPTQCADGVDNDGDGLIDVEDPDCTSPSDETEGPETGTPPSAGTPAPTPVTPAQPITPTPAQPEAEKEAGGKSGHGGKGGEGKGGSEEAHRGEEIDGAEIGEEDKRGGVTHNETLGDASGGGKGGAVEAPSATGGGDQPLPEAGDGGSPFSAGGAPTLANPTTTFAPFGPAPIGVPSFVIDSFEIPPFLLPIYQACGTEYGIPWQVLAAINKIETGFGTNLNVSSAGAVGWMQFLPSSWETYGLDANGDGRKDPYNPVDAICAAAHYLKVAGGQKHLYDAILAYNHADWYAQEVLLYARAYGRLPSNLVGSLTGLTEGAHFPIAANSRYADDISARAAIKRSDTDSRVSGNAADVISSSPTRRGINIFAKQGAPVVAVNDGVIRKMGHSAALGKFVVLEDTYGNRYTYAQLGKLVRSHRSIVTTNGKTERVPVESQDLRPRLRALPERESEGEGKGPGANATAAEEKVAEAAEKVETATADGTLKKGSRVIAGTLIGRVGKGGEGTDPHLNFSIRPAGKGAPRIDPKPILDGWKLLEATAIYRAKGKNPFASKLSGAGVLLLSKDSLEQRVLADKGLEIYPCGREDIESGQIDRRVLAVLEYLRSKGFTMTITALKCGHSYLTSSGNVSEHTTGDAVDIAVINGIPVTGHQGPGTLVDELIKDVLQLQGVMHPHQVISLEDLPGETSFALPDHYDHVHIGYHPLASEGAEESFTELLKPNQWDRLIQRLGQIENPEVPINPSKYSLPDSPGETGKSQESAATGILRSGD